MHRPLRLLAFSHSPHLGGSERVLLQLVRELVADREVACTVVLPGEGPLEASLRSAGADVWLWPSRWWSDPEPVPGGEAQRHLAAGASAVLTHLPRARSLDPHAVLSITTVSPWGALTAALLGRPHLWYVTDFGPAGADPPVYFLSADRVRHALREGADRLLVVSEAVRDRLFPEAAEPPLVVYPHLEDPTSTDGDDAWPEASPTRVAVFGNIRRSKGQWDAVSAVAELAARGLDTELLLVGPAGTEGPALEAHAHALGVGACVRILDFVPDQYVWMRRADIVMVPSHDETFSLVCLEALLRGKPLVATRVGGIVEFVRDGETGITVPARQPAALAAAVETLVRDPDLARRLADRGREEARRRFTAASFSGRVRKALDEAVARGRHRAIPPALLELLEALPQVQHRLEAQLWDERERARGLLESRLEREIELEHSLGEARKRAEEREAALFGARERLTELESDVARHAATLRDIETSRAWRLVQAYWRLVGRLRRRS